jgi:hypothetical protein
LEAVARFVFDEAEDKGVVGEGEVSAEAAGEGDAFGAGEAAGDGAVELVEAADEGPEGHAAAADVFEVDPAEAALGVEEEVAEFEVAVVEAGGVEAADFGAEVVAEGGAPGGGKLGIVAAELVAEGGDAGEGGADEPGVGHFAVVEDFEPSEGFGAGKAGVLEGEGAGPGAPGAGDFEAAFPGGGVGGEVFDDDGASEELGVENAGAAAVVEGSGDGGGEEGVVEGVDGEVGRGGPVSAKALVVGGRRTLEGAFVEEVEVEGFFGEEAAVPEADPGEPGGVGAGEAFGEGQEKEQAEGGAGQGEGPVGGEAEEVFFEGTALGPGAGGGVGFGLEGDASVVDAAEIFAQVGEAAAGADMAGAGVGGGPGKGAAEAVGEMTPPEGGQWAVGQDGRVHTAVSSCGEGTGKSGDGLSRSGELVDVVQGENLDAFVEGALKYQGRTMNIQ